MGFTIKAKRDAPPEDTDPIQFERDDGTLVELEIGSTYDLQQSELVRLREMAELTFTASSPTAPVRIPDPPEITAAIAQAKAYTDSVTASLASSASVSVLKDALPYKTLDTSLFSGINIDAAMTKAKTDLGANGGRIVVPRGAFEILNHPSFAETRNIVIEAVGGENSGALAPTRLTYKGTGPRIIDFRSAYGWGLRDVQIVYDQVGFTGYIVDLQHSISQDTAFGGARDCYFGGAGINTAAAAFLLDKAISTKIKDCNLERCGLGVLGRLSSGSYSNAITLDNVKFHLMRTAAIQAAGQGWSIKGCTFEQLVSGAAAAYASGGIGAAGVTFDGGWMGDVLGTAITVTAALDIFTSSTPHGFVTGQAVTFSGLTGGAGITAGTPYYVLASNLTATTFQVSATPGGAVLNITTDVTAGTVKGGTWIDWAGSGLVVKGLYMATGAVGVAFGPSSFGCEVAGNQFDGVPTTFTIAANCTGLDLHPNDWKNVTNKWLLGSGASRPAASRLPGPTNDVVTTDAPAARVGASANQSISNNTTTAITFNIEQFDNDAIHDNVTNNTRLTCKTPGRYLIGGSVRWASSAPGQRTLAIRLNGTTRLVNVDGPVDHIQVGTATWDPASLANGASAVVSVTVTGALLGDPAYAGLTSIAATGWTITAAVIATNTVEVRITNNTGGTVDLASGTVRAVVQTTSAANPGQLVVTTYDLIVGDYVELTAYQDSGAAVNVLTLGGAVAGGQESPQLWMVQVA